MGWLEGNIAIISGGASGIGKAVAHRFVAEGASVSVLDRNADTLARLQDELGDRCLTIAGDASTSEAAETLVSQTLERYGQIDTVVSNVGIFDWHKRLDRMTADECERAFEEIFAVNLRSHLHLARASAPYLKASGGSLTITCSTASFRGGGGGALYTASKFAARGLVYQLAHEWAPGVRVNGVAPGGTLTGLSGLDALGTADRKLEDDARIVAAVGNATPLGFIADSEDHTGAYVLLASSRNSRAMTGTIIVSDGGLLARI